MGGRSGRVQGVAAARREAGGGLLPTWPTSLARRVVRRHRAYWDVDQALRYLPIAADLRRSGLDGPRC